MSSACGQLSAGEYVDLLLSRLGGCSHSTSNDLGEAFGPHLLSAQCLQATPAGSPQFGRRSRSLTKRRPLKPQSHARKRVQFSCSILPGQPVETPPTFAEASGNIAKITNGDYGAEMRSLPRNSGVDFRNLRSTSGGTTVGDRRTISLVLVVDTRRRRRLRTVGRRVATVHFATNRYHPVGKELILTPVATGLFRCPSSCFARLASTKSRKAPNYPSWFTRSTSRVAF